MNLLILPQIFIEIKIKFIDFNMNYFLIIDQYFNFKSFQKYILKYI